ncbi:hypothetical protein [Streptomyces sp. CB02959]|uniref:hypothetical protein n=1 Tax=Streptomyces sp. CB02959 TaxID=2020330 RepID=UPI0026854B72
MTTTTVQIDNESTVRSSALNDPPWHSLPRAAAVRTINRLQGGYRQDKPAAVAAVALLRREAGQDAHKYHPGHFTAGDPPNQAVTAAAQCMYGIAHAVVTALGCAPELGFVHAGNERSFVLDIADLHKTDIGIPAAFDASAEGAEDVASQAKRP